MVERGHELRSLGAERVAGPGVDQRLDHTLVAQPQVDPVAQLDERAVRTSLPPRDDRCDRALADVADGAEPEADPPLTDDRELVARFVHVGREDLQVELARLVDVLHDAVGVADFRREQRRHVLGGIVDLEPRRLVRQDRIRYGVRLVEPVAAERLDLCGDFFDGLLIVPARDGALHEVAQLFLDQLLDLLAHRLPQHVGFGERIAGQRARDPHHLLLIDDHAVGRREDLFERWMGIPDLLPAELAVDEDEVHPGVEWAGTQQGIRRDQIVEPVALHVSQAVGRQRRFKLEDARGASGPQQLVHLRIVQIGVFEIDRHAMSFGDHRRGIVQHGERLQAEQVDLEHPDVLESHHVILRDDRVGVGLRVRRRADRDVIGQRPRRDHDARRVHRGVTCQALNPGS